MASSSMTIGTLLVGIFFNTYLYGLVTHQFAAYYRTKFNDRVLTKYMVLLLFILDTFHSISAIYMAWYYVVTSSDDPTVLARAVWPYQFTPIGTALAALVTQTYLGYRIWRLTDSKLLYGIVIMLSIPSFILGIGCSIGAVIIDVMSEMPRITSLMIVWLSMEVFIGTFITVTLIIIFSRSRTGFERTDTVLNRLIRGAVQTGLFTGIFSLGVLISFILLPDTNLYGMFAIPTGRIYTNTLLDTLLARQSLETELAGTYAVDGTGSLQWAPADASKDTSSVQSYSAQLENKSIAL